MDKSEIPTASNLLIEYNAIAAALAQLDDGGQIVSMIIGKLEPRFGVTVDTSYMFEHVPSQMIDSIKQLMTQRQNAITAEFNSMGVTGTTERAAPKADRRRK